MAKVHRGGRKKDEVRSRYPGGQLKPATDDFGPVEQRLKRDVAAGVRTVDEAERLSGILSRLSAANISQGSIGQPRVQKVLLKSGIVDQAELSLLAAFTGGPQPRMGLSAMDILLARRIIDRDHFDAAHEFVSSWCAYIGRPWPKGWSAERGAPDYNGGMSEAALTRMKVRYWNCLAAMDLVDKTIYPLVSDIVARGKMLGLVEEILRLDIVRIDGELIGRTPGRVPPCTRSRIGRLTRGIEIIANTQASDFTREAEALLTALKARELETQLTRL